MSRYENMMKQDEIKIKKNITSGIQLNLQANQIVLASRTNTLIRQNKENNPHQNWVVRDFGKLLYLTIYVNG